jgi:hypothetical protein
MLNFFLNYYRRAQKSRLNSLRLRFLIARDPLYVFSFIMRARAPHPAQQLSQRLGRGIFIRGVGPSLHRPRFHKFHAWSIRLGRLCRLGRTQRGIFIRWPARLPPRKVLLKHRAALRKLYLHHGVICAKRGCSPLYRVLLLRWRVRVLWCALAIVAAGHDAKASSSLVATSLGIVVCDSLENFKKNFKKIPRGLL